MGYEAEGGYDAYITFTPKVNTTHVRARGWYYYLHQDWAGPEWFVHEICQFSVPGSQNGWTEVDSVKPCVLTKDVQYTFRVTIFGGDTMWHKMMWLESVEG